MRLFLCSVREGPSLRPSPRGRPPSQRRSRRTLLPAPTVGPRHRPPNSVVLSVWLYFGSSHRSTGRRSGLHAGAVLFTVLAVRCSSAQGACVCSPAPSAQEIPGLLWIRMNLRIFFLCVSVKHNIKNSVSSPCRRTLAHTGRFVVSSVPYSIPVTGKATRGLKAKEWKRHSTQLRPRPGSGLSPRKT